MAGFDFHVPKSASAERLQRALLRWIQETARDLELDFKYRTENNEFWGVLNGPLPVMYALEAYLAEDLRTLAAGHAAPPDRRQRMLIAQRLLAAFRDGLDGITQMIHDYGRDLGGVPNSILFDHGAHSNLAKPLRSLTRVLILDIQGQIDRRTAVEEAHTGLELVLGSVLGRRARGLSFAEMVDAVVADGVLDAGEGKDVKRLKDIRRDAKHRGKGFDDDEAARLIAECVPAIQKLLARLRLGASKP